MTACDELGRWWTAKFVRGPDGVWEIVTHVTPGTVRTIFCPMCALGVAHRHAVWLELESVS